ncbi:glycosyl hydrolase [Phocaeicola paurosaccharolyticus]|uniref:glycosyl hydrolase n=1 Tax=Phocaeicola paurosaccharolyticus TaxID=732242 RepID=UPI000468AE84|nr:glycosyl hydrolase [Phocaeicola paurosaccharolyticus]
MRQKFIFILISVTIIFQGVYAESNINSLRNEFLKPSYQAKPWTFWYWMYGAVSKEGITADLQAMKENGLGGAYIMPIRGVAEGKQYKGEVEQLSDNWWNTLNYTLSEASRLGLKLGMHICDGFALAGGPWIKPEESMQKIVWSDTIISGGKKIDIQLAEPQKYESFYKDIATYAIPVKLNEKDSQIAPKITVVNLAGDDVPNQDKIVNIDAKGVIRSSYHCYINLEYQKPVTCRNVEIVLTGNNYQAHRMKMWASYDGNNYFLVKQFVAARHGWQNTDFNSSHSVPQVNARFYRFEWTPKGSEPGSEDLDAAKWKPDLKIKNIILHSSLKLNEWEGKAGLVWRVSEETSDKEIDAASCVKRSDIIRVSLKNGHFVGNLPKGEWRIVRIGHTSTGHQNATAGGGKGLECDKFSSTAVNKQVENWFGEVFRKCNPTVARKVLKYLHVDSWECGSQNWSDSFASEFKRRRGYDIIDILPVMTGVPIESASYSEKVLRDVRTTISELVSDVFYETVMACARKYDCLLSAECVSPTMVSDGIAHYDRVDLPMGEFWLNSPTHDKPNDMLDAISGAHIYGKKIIQAEGFTEVRGVWDETPAMLKPLLDRNYALGMNKLFYHVYTHNPWMDKKPGMTLEGIGLFFQRDQTWWNEGKAFTNYVARCQSLLQYGNPVIDIAVFTGEEMPRRAFLPDRLVSFLPGIFGKERVDGESLRLKNENEPIRVKPVGVTHSANMADPEKWINPLRGYAYDSFNKDALLRLAYSENGKIILPGGVEYSLLVIPGAHVMNPSNVPVSDEVKSKIDEFKADGVKIPSLPYLNEDFKSLGIDRDVELPMNIAWTHRRGEDADIYFLSNQSDSKVNFTASFRINDKKAELWNAVNGRMFIPAFQEARGNRMDVNITLDRFASIFVVFPKSQKSEFQSSNAQFTNAKSFDSQSSESQYSERQSSNSKSSNSHSSDSQSSVEIEKEFVHEKELAFNVKPWNVEFPLINKKLERKELFDWSKESDEKIKYYSGSALYSTSVKIKPNKHKRIFLLMEELHDVATVKVNGKECGIVWTYPYEIDITDCAKRGDNKLEIKITNTWANALRGADGGKAPFDGIWTNARYRMPGDGLLPAGLIGGIKFVERY